MKLWLFLLLFVFNVCYANTIIVFDEAVSRFVDRDMNYLAPVTTIYHSNRVWSKAELNTLGLNTDLTGLNDLGTMYYITHNNMGIPYFKNFRIKDVLAFLNEVNYPVSNVLIIQDNLHSLSVVPKLKQTLKQEGLPFTVIITRTKQEIESAVSKANLKNQTVILNFALTALEGETGVYLTYKEITSLMVRKNKRNIIVGLSRDNPICLCYSKASMKDLNSRTSVDNYELDLHISLNAAQLSKSNRKVLLDGVSKVKEIIFE